MYININISIAILLLYYWNLLNHGNCVNKYGNINILISPGNVLNWCLYEKQSITVYDLIDLEGMKSSKY